MVAKTRAVIPIVKFNQTLGNLSMKQVLNETYIPDDDLANIRRRLISHIESMSDSELRIAAKSEAIFQNFVSDLFKSIARIFGYLVGKVVNLGKDIAKSLICKDIAKSLSRKSSQVFVLEKAPQDLSLPINRSQVKVLKLEN